MYRSITPLLSGAFAVLATAGCGTAAATQRVTTATTTTAPATTPSGAASVTPAATAPDATVSSNPPGVPPLAGAVQRTSSGLAYVDEVVGTGTSPAAGQAVNVQYTGWLATGQKFDSSRDRNQPFTFTLGRSQVIAGWDEGVASMKVGGKRRLIVPPALGYGARGSPGAIPPNATLIFDVELLGIR
ncbi:MAG: FKBP-type peptidyl-prolyl cis-trans isomerase [Dehalococcoidia bacterium]|nr:FKBP-type peptidyl-prolyl cis-trans isomerase [Dehalococcoidia bacterium]